GRAVLPAFPLERARLHQRAHALLQEEGIAFRAFDQELLEGSETLLDPEQGLQQLVRALVRERVQAQARAGEALDEAVEQRLRFAVHPLQILEDQEQGLALAFTQQEHLDRLERALATLRRIERPPPRVLGGDVEQGQEGGQARLESRVERAQAGLDLVGDLARAVARLDLEVALEEIRD